VSSSAKPATRANAAVKANKTLLVGRTPTILVSSIQQDPTPPPPWAGRTADRADPAHGGRQSTGWESADPMRRDPALPGYRASERSRSYDRPLADREGEEREARPKLTRPLNLSCFERSYLNKMW
jgi:hypothetical protein